MSNEYKDWIADMSAEQRKIFDLCMEYPFLIPRDIMGNVDEDFEYDYLSLNIPKGWHRLFFQMCSDIKPILEREGVLDRFYFIQVKEKYNTLRCYHNGAPEEVDDIIAKYEQMACYICTICGKPATYETQGYIASFCDDCWKDFVRHELGEFIEFKPYYKIIRFSNGESKEETISFEDEWERYLSNLNN